MIRSRSNIAGGPPVAAKPECHLLSSMTRCCHPVLGSLTPFFICLFLLFPSLSLFLQFFLFLIFFLIFPISTPGESRLGFITAINNDSWFLQPSSQQPAFEGPHLRGFKSRLFPTGCVCSKCYGSLSDEGANFDSQGSLLPK